MTDAEVIARAKAGLGCLCRHELLDDRGPHCDGPLTSNGAGYCWTCAFIRHCGTWGDVPAKGIEPGQP